MSKKTEWISGRLKPVRVGVYERKLPPFVVFSYWDGQSWGCSCFAASEASLVHRISGTSNSQCRPWRGLLEETK